MLSQIGQVLLLEREGELGIRAERDGWKSYSFVREKGAGLLFRRIAVKKEPGPFFLCD